MFWTHTEMDGESWVHLQMVRGTNVLEMGVEMNAWPPLWLPRTRAKQRHGVPAPIRHLQHSDRLCNRPLRWEYPFKWPVLAVAPGNFLEHTSNRSSGTLFTGQRPKEWVWGRGCDGWHPYWSPLRSSKDAHCNEYQYNIWECMKNYIKQSVQLVAGPSCFILVQW